MTLLEVVIASSMLAMLMTAVALVMRTSRAAWDAQEADSSVVEAAHATLRHIVREIRQAQRVASVSDASDDSGRLAITTQDESVHVWEHDAGTNSVWFGVTTATALLAPQIQGLRFTCYQFDGVTVTTVPDDIQSIRIDVMFVLPRESGGQRTVSSRAWLRSWQ